MSKYSFHKLSMSLLCIVPALMGQAQQTQPAKATKTRPNVIIIYADDLGWNQLSTYGNKKVQTPNIDAIGNGGVKFTQAYATAPICSPSRVGLLTGRYQQRFGAEFLVPELQSVAVTDPELIEKIRVDAVARKAVAEKVDTAGYKALRKGIPESELLIGQLFKQAGYATGAIGKWHVGEADGLQPWKRGFDYYYGTLTWGTIYASVQDPNILTKSYHFHTAQSKLTRREGSIQITRNGQIVEETAYITDRIGEEAVGFIDQHKQDPFFLYVPFNAPHDPFQAKKADFDKITSTTDTTERIYLAMIASLDEAVGRIVNKLKQEGLEENTIIFFGSDNGGASYTNQMSNAPLKGGKLSHFEGGIRVPLLAKYPAKIKAGATYDYPVSNLDIFATAVQAAGVSLPADRIYDGVDLVPYVNKANTARPHETLYWRNGYSKAVRKGDWKLYINERNNKVLLYDLASDPGEQHDQSAANPAKIKELQTALKQWEKQLAKPRWPSLRSEVIGELADAGYYFPI
ncbi:sulfatase-like hydrolase/transferase [Paraflavitalea sp. CAU 1676]|uniref:sulfatase-like hydrolase/transferase n=1 Tax=Paraflavitalea sp. CAU 1676 TaxID=3032598 RepID=UPI0023D9D1BF|nr:sulfatase-like hydrolase/transferase [Paraflavitalea sp. CAU 1676]MDF2192343.1 sulfatase-like hydrolase/transferase [Paraflavitalea sp. CAU 1676]